ncbi:MAG: metal ABC transporter ATP-binding protein [Peptococcaceae bacterium]|nr:metal ABC transporter ATP-binding protein [Peptococcaceae bacterium]
MNKDTPAVELEKVSFSYGCHPVLEEISLTVYCGESVGITGPNGAGKSTLLKIAAGLLKPSSGSVKLFGRDARHFKERSRVSYVPQKASFINTGFPSTVEEVVLAGRIAGRGLFRALNREDRRLARAALAEVGMEEHCHRPIGALSGGQQQRVFIARALAGHPDILLLDEPAAGLDAEAQARFYTLLRELVRKNGLTLLLVSHDLEAIAPVVDRQVCLDKHICSCCHRAEAGAALDHRTCKKRLWTA